MKNKIDNLEELFQFENGDLVKDCILNSGDRIRRSFSELFSGYNLKADDILNETIKVDNYNGFVIMRDISFYTFCEHHFAPFYGKADIVYQPREIITGLGKLVRLVKDVHSKRMQIQEIMTKDIVDDIMRVLDSKGAGVRTKAKHFCICSRGPSDDNSWTESIYCAGSIDSDKLKSLLQN